VRADALAHTQLMMAQSIELLANHVEQSTGYQLTPITYAELPLDPKEGMIAWITDALLLAGSGGSVVVGGGTRSALVAYDGINWIVGAVKGTGVILLGTTTWAQLPASPLKGMLACISDSNRNGYSQTITGSGPYFVLALYDGVNWVVH
jgi:hypothetical protein